MFNIRFGSSISIYVIFLSCVCLVYGPCARIKVYINK